MLKIIHSPPTRSVRIVWLAEEMGLPYEAINEPFGSQTPEFLAMSPLGQFPAIEDGPENDRVRMIESIAILQYLMARHGPTKLAVAVEEKDFPVYLQFLEFGEAGLCSIGNALVATKFRAPEEAKKNWTSSYVAEAMRKRMDVVVRHLESGREYMAGDRFTAADISVGYGVMMYKYFSLLKDTAPALDQYYERISARPAFQKATAPLATAA